MISEKFAWRSSYPSGLFTVMWAFFTASQVYWFITRPAWDTGLVLAGYTCVLALEALAWRNRKRPVLEIRDEEVCYAPWPFGRQRRVPFREIDAIQISRWRRAILHLRSGKRMVVNLKLIEGFSRERAASALERVVGSATKRAQPAGG